MRRLHPYPLGLHPPRGVPYWYEPGPTSPHLGHTNHLCEMVKRGDDVEAYKALVKSVKFMCEICGRVAAKAENLCEPISLLIFCQHFLIANDCRWRACIV